MRKIISLLLCLAMICSLTVGIAEVNHPEYINYDSTLPIIKADEEPITLKVLVGAPAGAGKFEDLWVAKYIEKYFNVKWDVEQIPESALSERVSLLFASGDLPDLMLNLSLTNENIFMYGQEEGLLLKMDEYMDETLTPNMLRRFSEHPDVQSSATTPDGHIYTLPKMGENMDGTTMDRLCYNTAWLEACGLEAPKTLDDFLNMLRAFKEKDPAGVGSENVVPLAGSYENTTAGAYLNPGWYIMNALGFLVDQDDINAAYGVTPAILNGEAVLPVTTDLFKTYVETMKTMYEEGLVSSNFFLMDSTEITNLVLDGKTGVVPGRRVDSYGVSNWSDWACAPALTSETNPEGQWILPEATTQIGGAAISATTEYPELCMRVLDYFFSDECRIFWIGPADGSEEAMGYMGRTVNSSAASVASKALDASRFPAGISSNWDYMVGVMTFYPGFGAIDMYDSVLYYHLTYHNGEPADPSTLDPTFGDHWFRISALEQLTDKLTEGFPSFYYMSADDTYTLTELSTVIDPYVKEQLALFISGERSMDEYEAFQNELIGLGIEEYQALYQKVWSQKNGK